MTNVSIGIRRPARRPDHAGPGPLDALLLRVESDHEARLVGERDQRQVEQVAQLHQADAPCRRRRRRSSRRPPGGCSIIMPTGIAVDTRQAGDPRLAVVRRDLEERAVVDDAGRGSDGRRTRPRRLRGIDRTQRARRRRPVGRGSPRGGMLVHVARQVATGSGGSGPRASSSPSARLSTTPLTLAWIWRAAEILLGDVVAERGLDHRRAAGEDVPGLAHHHVPVGDAHLHRGQPGDRAHHRGHDRDEVEQVGLDGGERVAVGQVGAARGPRSCARCRRPRRAGGRRASSHSLARSLARSSTPSPPSGPPPEPPRTVKSPAVTTTLRPSIVHIPSTCPLGVKSANASPS